MTARTSDIASVIGEREQPKGNTPMVTVKPLDEPADLAGFRARRATLNEVRRRQKARDNFTAKAADDSGYVQPIDDIGDEYLGIMPVEEFRARHGSEADR
jgi:hypothetical protein